MVIEPVCQEKVKCYHLVRVLLHNMHNSTNYAKTKQIAQKESKTLTVLIPFFSQKKSVVNIQGTQLQQPTYHTMLNH